nr:Uncharacterised protein [Klebsiella pneumoniae]
MNEIDVNSNAQSDIAILFSRATEQSLINYRHVQMPDDE